MKSSPSNMLDISLLLTKERATLESGNKALTGIVPVILSLSAHKATSISGWINAKSILCLSMISSKTSQYFSESALGTTYVFEYNSDWYKPYARGLLSVPIKLACLNLVDIFMDLAMLLGVGPPMPVIRIFISLIFSIERLHGPIFRLIDPFS